MTFNARSGKHDDLVLALAIAVWRAHRGGNAGWVFLEAMRLRGMGSMASEPRYYIGVDLGQSRDPTAITVVRRVDPPRPVPEHDKPKPNYAPGSLEWEEEQWQSLPLTAQIRCTARGSQGVGGEVVRSTLTPLSA